MSLRQFGSREDAKAQSFLHLYMVNFKKIGHRGAKGHAAENTIASFRKALELGVDGIELDVHMSSDGIIMVIHDQTINRTTSGKGLVNDFTSAQLQHFGIPTLTEVIELVDRKCFINVEIKDPKATQPVIGLLQDYISKKNWRPDLFLISSFDWKVLEEVSSIDSSLKTGVLTEDNIPSAVTFAQKINAFSIHPYFELLNLENVSLIRENGFKIFPWTVNSAEEITFVQSLNVDGIISDFPDRI